MDEATIQSKSVWYPPGGILVWSLVFLELLTFSAALIALMVSSKSDPQGFHASRLLLNPLYGVVNTVFLLTSGYCMAKSVELFKCGNIRQAQRAILLTMMGGCAFLVLKAFEYSDKIEHGLTLGYDTFFTYYWLLTCFHVMHVLVGLVILAVLFFRLRPLGSELNTEDFEAGAVFWHMCDLIWLVLFPVLYLLL